MHLRSSDDVRATSKAEAGGSKVDGSKNAARLRRRWDILSSSDEYRPNKLAIVAAGPAANFALAILVLFALFLRGETGLAPIIESVEVGSVAAEAGLKVGQEIVAVDSEPTRTVSNVRFALLQ